MKHENHWKWINGAYFWVKLIGFKDLIVLRIWKESFSKTEEIMSN